MLYYVTRLCSVRGVNAYLKTQQCVATTIWYSYFSYTILSYGLQLREHWLSIHPEKGWLLRCLSDSSAIAGSVNARVQYACACC